jgi:hypothetical protein
MKQFAWPSNWWSIGRPAMWSRKLSVKISTAKWATDPALDAGMSEASPSAKMLSCSVDRKVCLSTGT